MCPPAAYPANNIGLYWNEKEIFMSLKGIIGGAPLPGNVIADINPYLYQLSDLRGVDGKWFLVKSKAKNDADFGYWRTKGDACQIFSDPLSTGWRSTLELFDGQAPHGNKTDWVMQEYWMNTKHFSGDNNNKEISFLCNVFFVDEQNPSHLKPSETTQVNAANRSAQPVAQKVVNDSGATSNPQMGENGTRSSSIIGEWVTDNGAGMANYDSEGDFLELGDLDNPASPSSSSDSSCVTMSSDECFDALELLQDLESKKRNDPVQNNTGVKLSVHVSSRPTEMVAYPASTGTLDKLPNQELLSNGVSIPSSEIAPKISDKKVMSSPNQTQKPASKSEDQASTSRGGRRKKLNMKYLCFLSF